MWIFRDVDGVLLLRRWQGKWCVKRGNLLFGLLLTGCVHLHFSSQFWDFSSTLYSHPRVKLKSVFLPRSLAFRDGPHSVSGLCFLSRKIHFLPITLSLTEPFLWWDIKKPELPKVPSWFLPGFKLQSGFWLCSSPRCMGDWGRKATMKQSGPWKT